METELALIEGILDHGIDVKAVDLVKGIIPNVKIAGFKSPSHGREYDPAALKDALPLYESAAVNIDHTEVGTPPMAKRFGFVKNARFVENDGVRGDIHFNPKHPMADHVMWLAEHAPGKLGMSHHAYGAVGRGGSGALVVKKINRVKSVDIVTDPATTAGLFESEGGGGNPTPEVTKPPAKGGGKPMELKDLKLTELQEARPDLIKDLTASVVKELQESESAKAEKKELDELRIKVKVGERRELVEKKLLEAKLPTAVVTDLFKQTLMEAKDEPAIGALIEDRKKLATNIKATTPKATESTLTESQKNGNGTGTGTDRPAPTNGKEMAAAMRGF